MFHESTNLGDSCLAPQVFPALLCGLCVSPQRPFESLCAAALALRVHRAQDKNRREQNSARGKPFRRFKKWLEEQPPYDIVIDGANVTRLKVMTD